jgi:benzoyl-CoA 2,3-dioxygenase component A
MRREADTLSQYLADANTHIYVCGLKGMEQGVDAALDDICRGAQIKWSDIRTAMRDSGRYHMETY